MPQTAMSAMKDRKVLRRVDLRAARTSVSGLLAALVIYAILATWGGFYRDHETLALLYGAGDPGCRFPSFPGDAL